LIAGILLISTFILVGLTQQSLVLAVYNIKSAEIPKQFDGYRIAHISDFHSGLFSGSAADIIELTKEQEPNIICLTGDIVDSKTQDYDTVEQLISGLLVIAPIYAVSGNNEAYDPSIGEKMEELYEKYGVRSLDGRTAFIYECDSMLALSGIADQRSSIPERSSAIAPLERDPDSERFDIMLSHRANEFGRVAGAGYGLVLSGHLHGGIIRLPLIGGLLSPDGDLLPRFSGGLYEANGTYLISNRGIGNNYPIPRIYNPPEIVIVVLRSEEPGHS